MKNLIIILVLFCFAINSNAQKNLWQLPKHEPSVAFNHNNEMAVFTYDRISIYNLDSGAVVRSFDLLENRSENVWPGSTFLYTNDNFNYFQIFGKIKGGGQFNHITVNFDANKGSWREAETYVYYKENKRGVDFYGNDVVYVKDKTSAIVYSPKGKKVNVISKSTPTIVLTSGGKYGLYSENNSIKIYDFEKETVKSTSQQGNLGV